MENKAKANVPKTAEELSVAYHAPLEVVAKRFNELAAAGMGLADAAAAVEGELAAGKLQRPKKTLLIPVKESKPPIESCGKGMHRVKILDIIPGQRQDGSEYLAFDFRRKDGKGIYGFCSPVISQKSKLYDWIKGITGKAPQIGTKFDVMGLIESECNVYVKEDTKEDGTPFLKVEDVTQAEGE